MYLPRSLISHLYLHLSRNHHPLSPPVVVLVALEPDALCACRILTSLLKRDYIPHKIHPVAGYAELAHAGTDLIQPLRLTEGGTGGVVVCLGVGGLVDLESILGLHLNEDGTGGFDGVNVWVFDSRRPWNLANVFAGAPALTLDPSDPPPKEHGLDHGQISRAYRPEKGGIIVFDDGDIQEDLGSERDAWFALEEMPDLDDNDNDSDHDDERDLEPDTRSAVDPQSRASPEPSPRGKRKSWSDAEDEDAGTDSEKENERPYRKRRSNSSTPITSSPTKYNNRSSAAAAAIIQATPPSNQQSSPPVRAAEPSPRALRRKFNRLRRAHHATIQSYHSLGTSYSEPISSLMYSLASELGREDNDLLWLAIVGVSSTELYGHTPTGISLTNHDAPAVFTGWTGSRGSRIRQILRDETRRLNPPELNETGREIARGQATDIIPTHARSPTDTSIRLSPEPRFLLIRHWSLYDSMLHSPYLSAKLHIWSDAGRRRLHKLLAKMGVSLTQCRQNYTHMDMDLKKDLRQKLLHFAPVYGLDGLLPPPSSGRGNDTEGWGFVRSWGWNACLSATDVAVIIGAILEVGAQLDGVTAKAAQEALSQASQSATASQATSLQAEEALHRFYTAYDALLSPRALMGSIPLAQSLHRAILRTGTSLLQKRQIRHLRAFRMAIVKEGPDMNTFTNPGALTKLALWVGEAVGEMEKDQEDAKTKRGGTPLVLGCVDEARGLYVVVGMGGGSSSAETAGRKQEKQEKKDKKQLKAKEKEAKREAKRKEGPEKGQDDDEEETEDDDSDDDNSSEDDEDDADEETSRKRGIGRNRFGNAFQEVVEETNARIRLDSFDHCVVEVKKDDLSGFLESLSMKAVVA